MTGFVPLPSGGPYLAPHPWDALGEPPTPGRAYEEAGPVEDLEKWLELLSDIEDAYASAEEHEAEAREAERRAHNLEEKADTLRAALIIARPDWEDALFDERDPREE